MFAGLFPPPAKEPEAFTQLKAKLASRKPGSFSTARGWPVSPGRGAGVRLGL